MRNCRMIKFKGFFDERGGLVAIENNKNLPFEIKRVYYIYNVPQGLERGFHSHRNLEQVLIAVSGSVKIRVKDGKNEETYELKNPDEGLFIGNMIWREMFDFSDKAVLLVLANHEYNPDDYIKDYKEYLNISKEYFKDKDRLNDILSTDTLNLDLVDVNDAEFLYNLRTNKELTKYISPISGSIADQIEWINKYKIKEYQGKEFYFCISDLNNEKLGFVRLYNIDYNKKVLTFGSFLLKENHPKLTALESMIIMLNISFDYLNMEKVELDVRINNEHAKHFYQRFGFVKTKENNIDEFYEMTRENYDKLYNEKYYKYVRRKIK